MVTAHYREGENRFTQEAFISYPDNCLVLRFRSAEPVDYVLSADTQVNGLSSITDHALVLTGEAPTDLTAYGSVQEQTICYTGEGVRFATVARPVTDGIVIPAESTLLIRNATQLTVLVAVTTSFIRFDIPPTRPFLEDALERSKALTLRSFEDLFAAHSKDYQRYYQRLRLDLCFPISDLPTDQRLRVQDKSHDLGLIELLFNFGRYLLIACSREGSQAANLQGIWNESLYAPWCSDYHTNINVEMNYWPVFMCNLAELHEPFVALVEKIRASGEHTARQLYGAEGFCCHSCVDIWGNTDIGGLGIVSENRFLCFSYWNLSAAWCCTHLWEQYEYTLDQNFLAETAYPLMKGAAQFLLSILTEYQGQYFLIPSTSPENLYYLNGRVAGLAKFTTMSQAITQDLFTDLLRASQVLNIEDDFVKQIRQILPKLGVYRIGSQGQLLEFDEEYEEEDIHHRHISHLYGLYPGESITTSGTPELAEACRVTLERRGDESTGWAMGWRVNCWAKLKDGNRALTLLKNQLRFREGDDGRISYGADGGTYPNLFDAHPPFQIDGNLGICAGIVQMLLQCEDGKLRILPALPDAFQKGRVTGLKAKGNITVDIAWQDGRLISCTLESPISQTVTVVTPLGEETLHLTANRKTAIL